MVDLKGLTDDQLEQVMHAAKPLPGGKVSQVEQLAGVMLFGIALAIANELDGRQREREQPHTLDKG